MLGSLLAGTDCSPGTIFKTETGELRKTYRGMASAAAQRDWRGRVSSCEGISSSVPYRGKLADVIKELERGIRSGLSYSGARDIKQLYQSAKWTRQSGASSIESTAHINIRK